MADVLDKSKDLSKFIKQINHLSKINQAVKEHLTPDLASHCRVANLRDGVLILRTSSSIWGHQLRFQEMALLSALRTMPEWCGLKSIQSRVVPLYSEYASHPKAPYPHPKPRLSLKNKAHLEAIAHHIVYPHLKRAVLCLAMPSQDINK
jgi:hypothetical protein